MDIDELDPATRAFEALRQEVRALGEKIDSLISATDRAPDIKDRRTVETSQLIGEFQADAKAQQSEFSNLVHELRQELEATRVQQFDLQMEKAEVLSFRDLTRWIAGAMGLILGIVIAAAIM